VDRQAADDFHKGEAFLRDHLGALYCDACLAATTDLDKVRITNTALNLGPGIQVYLRTIGTCSECKGQQKSVIKHTA
jgi:hypothetical protein